MDIQDLKHLLLPTFKLVSLVFAIAAIVTGAQAVFFPTAFSQSFGIPIHPSPITINNNDTSSTTSSNSTTTTTKTNENKPPPASLSQFPSNAASTYVSLMGIRQLTTGLILLFFISQKKWTEIATILSILGVVVAGTDGVFLARAGRSGLGVVHALPGGGIAVLAGGVLILGVDGVE